MTIAIIGSRGYPYVYSGYETFVKELSERLVRRGYRVKVYCHRNLFQDRPPKVNGIELIYIPTIETKTLSQLVHSFLSMLHACTIGKAHFVLAVNAANGPFGLMAKIARIPSAINVDGLEWLRPKWKGLGARYFKWAAWLSTKWYDAVITDAVAMQGAYQALFQKDSTVIAYGASPRTSQDSSLIEAFGLAPQEYYLIVGRLIPDNNAALLLQGFLAAHSQKKLVIVGDVPYQDEYASQLKNQANEQIVFTGYVTDSNQLAELYHHCFAYLHGHEFGGTNPTMLKAMAYGTAILALDTVFNREMLQEELFGKYFTKDTNSIAQCLIWAEENPAILQTMRSHSKEGLGTRYDWEIITDQYIALINSVCSQKTAKPKSS